MNYILNKILVQYANELENIHLFKGDGSYISDGKTYKNYDKNTQRNIKNSVSIVVYHQASNPWYEYTVLIGYGGVKISDQMKRYMDNQN